MRTNLILAFIVLSQPLCAQLPTLRTGTQIVIVDVNVSDSHGNPVHGLKASDFTIIEDSTAQTITRVDEHTASSPNAPVAMGPVLKLEPGVYTNYTPAPATDRPLNVVLLDTLNTPLNDQVRVRDQLKSFVKGQQPGTRIAIFGLTTRLILLQGFTSEPSILRAALDHKKAKPSESVLLPAPIGAETIVDGADAAGLSAEAVANLQEFQDTMTSNQNQMRRSITLDALNQISRYLASFPGRKNLIWFAGSIPIYISPYGDTADTMNVSSPDVVQTNGLLTQSQIAVFPVDARGLFSAPMLDASNSGRKYAHSPTAYANDLAKFSAQTADEHIAMNQLAASTGGKAFFNNNDLRAAVRSAIEAGSNYYTLIYTPANKDWSGKFRTFHIKTAQAGLQLTYRRGYYAAPSAAIDPSAPQKATASMQAAMQRGGPAPTEVLFKAQVIPAAATTDKAAPNTSIAPATKGPFRQYTISYAALPTDVTMPVGKDGNHEVAMQFVAIAYDRDGKALASVSNTVSASLKPELYAQVSQQGLKYTQTLSVPTKSEVFFRIGLDDLLGHKVGALEVPASVVPASSTK